MQLDELDRIERELSISLPPEYRAGMCPFPVAAFARNSELDLWDDAEELIRWNRSLRTGTTAFGAPQWPPGMFSLGFAGASSCYAIDLKAEPAPVWWVDHWHLDARGSGIVSPSFQVWLDEFLRDVRHDCLADGIDPDEAGQ